MEKLLVHINRFFPWIITIKIYNIQLMQTFAWLELETEKTFWHELIGSNNDGSCRWFTVFTCCKNQNQNGSFVSHNMQPSVKNDDYRVSQFEKMLIFIEFKKVFLWIWPFSGFRERQNILIKHGSICFNRKNKSTIISSIKETG